MYSNKPSSGLGSLTKRKLSTFNISFNTKESVSAIRFEDYWANNLKRRDIDLLKLDIEGSELNALRVFCDALKHTKVIQFEYGGCYIDTLNFLRIFCIFCRMQFLNSTE